MPDQNPSQGTSRTVRIWRHADSCRAVWARKHDQCSCGAEPFVPEQALLDATAALDQALTDLKGIAADSTDEARQFVQETAEPRIRAAIAATAGVLGGATR